MVAGLELTRDHLEAFFPQRLAGLGARVVELAGLADDDGPGADQQDLPDVSPLWHRGLLPLDLPVDDGGLGRSFLALVEQVIEPRRSDPHRFPRRPRAFRRARSCA